MSAKIESIHIVDIGARGGLTFDISNANFPIRVFLFEPDLAECQRLQIETSNTAFASFHFYPIALSSKEESKTLFITFDPACSSIYQPIEDLSNKYQELNCTRLVNQKQIRVTTLDIWAKQQKLEYIDYLKIDTQGSELDILMGGPEMLSKTSLVEVEVEFSEIYSNQPLFADVDLFMRTSGFFLWRLNNLVHYSDQKVLELSQMDRFYNSVNYPNSEPGGRLYWGHAYYLNQKSYLGNELKFERLSRVANMLGMHDFKNAI